MDHFVKRMAVTLLLVLLMAPCAVWAADSSLKGIEFRPLVADSEGTGTTYGFSLDFTEFLEKFHCDRDWGFVEYEVKINWAKEKNAEIDPTRLGISFQPSFFRDGWSSILDFQGAYEAGNHFDQQNLTLGLWAGVTKSTPRPRSRIAVNIGYDVAATLHSEYRKELNEDPQTDFGRASGQVLGILWLPYLRFGDDAWMLSAEYHYYYQHVLASSLIEDEKGDYNYFRATLAYEFEKPVWKVWRSIFVQYTSGRLPTQLSNESLFWFGVKFLGQ